MARSPLVYQRMCIFTIMSFLRFVLASLVTYFAIALCLQYLWLYKADSATFNTNVLSKLMAVPVLLNLWLVLLAISLGKSISSHIFSTDWLKATQTAVKASVTFTLIVIICGFMWMLLIPPFLVATSVVLWIPWSYFYQISGLNTLQLPWFFMSLIILTLLTLPPLGLYKLVGALVNRISGTIVHHEDNHTS